MSFTNETYPLRGRVDFDHCNRCGHKFARRGVVVDMNDFRDHKLNCVANVVASTLADNYDGQLQRSEN